MGLFSSTRKDSQLGVEFLPDGVALTRVRTRGTPGEILDCEFIEASSQEDQVESLKSWVRKNNLQKTPCVCLIADDDFDSYQVEKPEVEEAEMLQAVTWKIKDLINFDVSNAVVDSYPMPVSSKNNQQQIGVVAAREAVVGNYVNSIRSCGVELIALDVAELARSNLHSVRKGGDQSVGLLSLTRSKGLLSIYQDGDLYVNREFMIGIDQLAEASADDESAYDSLLLELQRSLDYFESFYGMGSVQSLRIFPQLPTTEKMAMYLQNLIKFDIEFVSFSGDGDTPALDAHCFHVRT